MYGPIYIKENKPVGAKVVSIKARSVVQTITPRNAVVVVVVVVIVVVTAILLVYLSDVFFENIYIYFLHGTETETNFFFQDIYIIFNIF